MGARRARRIVEPEDRSTWREGLPQDFGRRSAPARGPLRLCLAGRWLPPAADPRSSRAGPGSGEGRGDVLRERRLCPAVVQARRGRAGRGHHRRLHRHHPLRFSDRHSHRTVGSRARPIMSPPRVAIPMAARSGCRWRAGSPSTPWRRANAPSSISCPTAGPARRRACRSRWCANSPNGRVPPRSALRLQRAEAIAKKRPPIRVRALGAADLRALRVRDARRCRRLLGAQ